MSGRYMVQRRKADSQVAVGARVERSTQLTRPALHPMLRLDPSFRKYSQTLHCVSSSPSHLSSFPSEKGRVHEFLSGVHQREPELDKSRSTSKPFRRAIRFIAQSAIAAQKRLCRVEYVVRWTKLTPQALNAQTVHHQRCKVRINAYLVLSYQTKHAP